MAKTKEKDVITQLLEQIDFHWMAAGKNGLLKKLTSRFYSKAPDAATRKKAILSLMLKVAMKP
ncbi:MAG: hypothetical protein IKP51_01580 [Treponema sp.]|nr:hypothetical protein [Treponema sp.]